MNIVLCGAPGAGKDTLANGLLQKFPGSITLNTGEMYRKEAELGTEFGLRAKSFWDSGNLCPDDMTNELMEASIKRFNSSKSLIFNGYPRTIEQAHFLDKIQNISYVLLLNVDTEILIDRLLRRGRLDDDRDVIETRIDVYNSSTLPVIDYYQTTHRVKAINANLEIENVLCNTVNLLISLGFQ